MSGEATRARHMADVRLAARAGLSVLTLTAMVSGPWAKRADGTHSILAVDGGSGFGWVALAAGILLVALSIVRLSGQRSADRIVAVEQATALVSFVLLAVSVSFVVGWLRVIPAGTGWAVVGTIALAWVNLSSALVALSDASPEPVIEAPLRRHLTGLAAASIVLGVAIVLSPWLDWLRSGDVSVAGYDGGSRLPAGLALASGPRHTYLLALIGIVVVGLSGHRLVTGRTAEPGPLLLSGHLLLAAGAVTLVLPATTALSALAADGVQVGVGPWVASAAGGALCAVATIELRSRARSRTLAG